MTAACDEVGNDDDRFVTRKGSESLLQQWVLVEERHVHTAEDVPRADRFSACSV